jgi:hypothetical protein
MGNAGLNTFYKIYNLPNLSDDSYYYWQVQAVDGGFKGGEWSVVDSFQIEATQAYFTFDTVCQGFATQFTDNSVAYDGIINWNWNFGDTTAISNLQNPTHIFQFAGEHQVQLIVTNANGKSDTIENTVLVKAIPNVNFTATDVCSGTTTVITNNTSISNIDSWVWDFGDNSTSIYSNPGSHVYSSIGKYVITLWATASNGCSNQDSQSIVITTTPSAVLTLDYGSPTFCSGDSVIYSATLNNDYIYQWQLEDENISNTSNQLKVKSISGNYKVIVTNNLATSCIDTSVVKTITVNPSPASPIITTPENTSFCSGDSILLSTNELSDINYQWLINEGNIAQADSYQLYAKSGGDYKIRISNTYGCQKESDALSLTMSAIPSNPSVSYGETEFCEGGSLLIKTAYSTTDAEKYTFQWINNGNPITDATGTSYLATESGTYWLEVLNTDGCEVKTSTIEVKVDTKPATPIIREENNLTTFCPNTEVKLLVDNASSNFNYQWQRSGVDITGATQQVYEGKLKSGDYSVVVSSGACSNESSILTLTTKTAPDKPDIYARGPNVWMLACSNQNASGYRWYFNEDLISGANSYTYVADQNLGDYYVEINEGGECWTMSDIINIPSGEITSGVSDLLSQNVSVFPNPSDGKFTIAIGQRLPGQTIVLITNELGKTILSEKYMDINGLTLDLSQMQPGIYFCSIKHKANVVMKKLIKNN